MNIHVYICVQQQTEELVKIFTLLEEYKCEQQLRNKIGHKTKLGLCVWIISPSS